MYNTLPAVSASPNACDAMANHNKRRCHKETIRWVVNRKHPVYRQTQTTIAGPLAITPEVANRIQFALSSENFVTRRQTTSPISQPQEGSLSILLSNPMISLAPFVCLEQCLGPLEIGLRQQSTGLPTYRQSLGITIILCMLSTYEATIPAWNSWRVQINV